MRSDTGVRPDPRAWSVTEPLTSPSRGTQASSFPSSNTSNARPWHSTSAVPLQTAMFRGSCEGPAEATSRATLSSADSVGSQGVVQPPERTCGPGHDPWHKLLLGTWSGEAGCATHQPRTCMQAVTRGSAGWGWAHRRGPLSHTPPEDVSVG